MVQQSGPVVVNIDSPAIYLTCTVSNIEFSTIVKSHAVRMFCIEHFSVLCLLLIFNYISPFNAFIFLLILFDFQLMLQSIVCLRVDQKSQSLIFKIFFIFSHPLWTNGMLCWIRNRNLVVRIKICVNSFTFISISDSVNVDLPYSYHLVIACRSDMESILVTVRMNPSSINKTWVKDFCH